MWLCVRDGLQCDALSVRVPRGVTERIGFATGVLVLPQRQTALVAHQAADVDLLSGGRLRLGVGVGYHLASLGRRVVTSLRSLADVLEDTAGDIRTARDISDAERETVHLNRARATAPVRVQLDLTAFSARPASPDRARVAYRDGRPIRALAGSHRDRCRRLKVNGSAVSRNILSQIGFAARLFD